MLFILGRQYCASSVSCCYYLDVIFKLQLADNWSSSNEEDIYQTSWSIGWLKIQLFQKIIDVPPSWMFLGVYDVIQINFKSFRFIIAALIGLTFYKGIGSKIQRNKLGLSWAKLIPSWGLRLEFEVEVWN